MLVILLAFYMPLLVSGDLYMQMLRGSNNRLNEPTATRKTGNRMFDSQIGQKTSFHWTLPNNARGGYNVGDRNSNPAGRNYANQYRMKYFQSSLTAKSKVRIEWTNQHGCGGNENNNPHKLNCVLVLQYTCQPDMGWKTRSKLLTRQQKKELIQSQLRDGTSTTRNDHSEPSTNKATWKNNYNNRNKEDRGMNEPYEWYDKCTTRDRNKGLFTADQKLKGDDSTHTRQNANGNRNGYECPEERDYYPYWHPTDWKDIAVLASNTTMCPYYKNESYNVNSKWECVEKWAGSQEARHFSKHNNQKDCTDNGGEWLEFHNFLEKAKLIRTEADCIAKKYIWGRPIYGTEKECLVPLSKPDCVEAPWTRVNHLGNAGGSLETPGYDWDLPHFPSKTKQRCVVRMRYNISTDDYDPWNTNSSSNNDKTVISNNPQVDIGAPVKLQLNINTAQFGRTFQDRSHVFKIIPRPRYTDQYTIHNIQVRGKRGNIVQTFPATEYDFTPTNLTMSSGDIAHIHWTGSNTHNNGGNPGDGQAGDAGQGRGGTDRHNLVGMLDRNHNYPMFAEHPNNLFNNIEKIHWSATIADLNDCDYEYTAMDAYVQYASSGYYACVRCNSVHSLDSKKKMQAQLNDAPASYPGMMLQLKKGTYHFMSTRNNAFTNRSQKGSLHVV